MLNIPSIRDCHVDIRDVITINHPNGTVSRYPSRSHSAIETISFTSIKDCDINIAKYSAGSGRHPPPRTIKICSIKDCEVNIVANSGETQSLPSQKINIITMKDCALSIDGDVVINHPTGSASSASIQGSRSPRTINISNLKDSEIKHSGGLVSPAVDGFAGSPQLKINISRMKDCDMKRSRRAGLVAPAAIERIQRPSSGICFSNSIFSNCIINIGHVNSLYVFGGSNVVINGARQIRFNLGSKSNGGPIRRARQREEVKPYSRRVIEDKSNENDRDKEAIVKQWLGVKPTKNKEVEKAIVNQKPRAKPAKENNPTKQAKKDPFAKPSKENPVTMPVADLYSALLKKLHKK